MLNARTPVVVGKEAMAGRDDDAHDRLHGAAAAGRRARPLVRGSLPIARALRCAHLVTGIGADMLLRGKGVVVDTSQC